MASLELALDAESPSPEMTQTLLNLAEFMEHNDKPLPIDIRKLGTLAEKCHAYAKARHTYHRYTYRSYTQYSGHTQNTLAMPTTTATLTVYLPRQGAALPRDRVALVPGRDHRGPHLDQHPAAAARGRKGHPRARTAAPPGILTMALLYLPWLYLLWLYLLWLYLVWLYLLTHVLTLPGRAQGVLVREAAAVGGRARGIRAQDDRGPAQLHLDARPHALPGGARRVGAAVRASTRGVGQHPPRGRPGGARRGGAARGERGVQPAAVGGGGAVRGRDARRLGGDLLLPCAARDTRRALQRGAGAHRARARAARP